MRTTIPTPIVIAILVVVAIGLGLLLYRQAGPQAAENEDLIRAAFGGKGTTPPKFPAPPGGAPGAVRAGGAPIPPPAPR